MKAIAETFITWSIAADAMDLVVAEWKLAAMAGLIACMIKIAR